MKYLAILAVLMTVSIPAFAQEEAVSPVIAKTSAEQRALAQALAGRIQTMLDAEPYDFENDCADENCTASVRFPAFSILED